MPYLRWQLFVLTPRLEHLVCVLLRHVTSSTINISEVQLFSYVEVLNDLNNVNIMLLVIVCLLECTDLRSV